VCFSQPAMASVLSDWIVELGSMNGVRDVDVWMSENLHGRGGCGCELCKGHDRNVLEAQAIVKAWQKARERLPSVGLRALTSEETYGSNREILKVLPREVKLVYYHSLLTYTAARQPMVDELIATEAASGRSVGITPQLSGLVGPPAPFTGPQFIQYRMQEFCDKGLSSFTGYATPLLAHNLFNVEAAAEWSWNPDGRSPEEFARSYAMRRGLADPDSFARWALLVGQAGWQLYGSEWPTGERHGPTRPLVKSLKKGKLMGLGETLGDVWRYPWAEFHSSQELRRALTDAQEAVGLAKRMGEEDLLQESLYLQGCAQVLVSTWELGQCIDDGSVKEGQEERAAREMRAFVAGCRQAADADRKWAQIRAPSLQFEPGSRYSAVVDTLEGLAGDMEGLAAELGVGLEGQ